MKELQIIPVKQEFLKIIPEVIRPTRNKVVCIQMSFSYDDVSNQKQTY